jgi:uracil-DNA glycosylase
MNRSQITEHLKFAAELGVAGISRDPAWRRRADPQPGSASSVPAAEGTAAADNSHSPSADDTFPGGDTFPVAVTFPVTLAMSPADALTALRQHIGPQCVRCKLGGLGRRQVVFGEGNAAADLMFVGEGPGADEDELGVPFIGRAGQLLTKIIEAIQLTRGEVYIANVVKCRPPQNRNPEPDEINTCEPFLFQQIDIIKPKVVVALGKFAAQTLLRSEDPISRLRGRVFDYRSGAKLVPTFHPAYLLRNPSSKREVWEDIKLVQRILNS